MTDDPQDKEFERYLAGDSPLSRRYAELGTEGASPELDAQIRAEAERAAKVWYLPLTGPARRWTAPVALAATVLLSFSLVMSIVFQERLIPVDDEMPMGDADHDSNYVTSKARATPERALLAAPAQSTAVFALEEKALGASSMANEAEVRMDRARVRSPELLGMQELVVTARESPLAGEGLIRSDLGSAIEVIRDHFEVSSSRAADQMAPVAAAREKESALIESTLIESTMAPEARLAGILTLYDENKFKEANLELVEFRRIYPDHPVSTELARRGL